MGGGHEEAGLRQAVHRGDGLPRALSGRGVARAVAFKPHRRLLDIAGGSGVYACCLVEEHPHLRATVLERPPVDEVARTAIAEPRLQRPGVGSRGGHAVRAVSRRSTSICSERAARLGRAARHAIACRVRRRASVRRHRRRSRRTPERGEDRTAPGRGVFVPADALDRRAVLRFRRDARPLQQNGFTNVECLQTLGDRSVIVAAKA